MGLQLPYMVTCFVEPRSGKVWWLLDSHKTEELYIPELKDQGVRKAFHLSHGTLTEVMTWQNELEEHPEYWLEDYSQIPQFLALKEAGKTGGRSEASPEGDCCC